MLSTELNIFPDEIHFQSSQRKGIRGHKPITDAIREYQVNWHQCSNLFIIRLYFSLTIQIWYIYYITGNMIAILFHTVSMKVQRILQSRFSTTLKTMPCTITVQLQWYPSGTISLSVYAFAEWVFLVFHWTASSYGVLHYAEW